jgi:hypothetical protein
MEATDITILLSNEPREDPYGKKQSDSAEIALSGGVGWEDVLRGPACQRNE